MTDSAVGPTEAGAEVVPPSTEDPRASADPPVDDEMAASRDSFPASDPPSSWWGGAGDRARTP